MNDTSTHETAPNIRVAVIEPGGPVNVGSIARAMANFAFDDLVLVGNDVDDPDGRGARVAMGGAGVFAGRRIADTLDAALEGCGLVIGATRRARSDESCIDFREAARIAARRPRAATVALLFGRERDGFMRQERERCHILAEIPSVEGTAGSLNISHAAALFLCAIYCELGGPEPVAHADPEALLAAFDDLFKRSGTWEANGRAQRIFHGLLARAGLTPEEAELLERSFRLFGARIQPE